MALSDRHCAFLVAALLTPMFWSEADDEVVMDDVLDLWEQLAIAVDRKIALKRAEDVTRSGDNPGDN